jgi:hypothetical protein
MTHLINLSSTSEIESNKIDFYTDTRTFSVLLKHRVLQVLALLLSMLMLTLPSNISLGQKPTC